MNEERGFATARNSGNGPAVYTNALIGTSTESCGIGCDLSMRSRADLIDEDICPMRYSSRRPMSGAVKSRSLCFTTFGSRLAALDRDQVDDNKRF